MRAVHVHVLVIRLVHSVGTMAFNTLALAQPCKFKFYIWIKFNRSSQRQDHRMRNNVEKL